jgi:hypothetical protein
MCRVYWNRYIEQPAAILFVFPLLASASQRGVVFVGAERRRGCNAGTKGKPDPEKPFSFRTAHSALIGFASVFEAAGVANNHSGDFGREDFVETIAALRWAGSQTFGGGKDQAEAHRAAIFERNGVTIALLGYLDFFPRWFAAAPGMPGVAWLDEDQAALDIAKAKADGADVVVVIPHWGRCGHVGVQEARVGVAEVFRRKAASIDAPAGGVLLVAAAMNRHRIPVGDCHDLAVKNTGKRAA